MPRLHPLAATITGLLLAVYVGIGYAWARHTGALTAPDVLFHADTPRVLWNETSVGHVQARTVLHPLHVLMTTPLGVPLTALFGFRELSAVLITALFAAGTVYALDLLLRRATSLPPALRISFVLLLGVSAGQLTFASVPETHVISAFFLALVACHLAKFRTEAIERLPARLGDWPRLFAGAGLVQLLFAGGALVTNVLLAPLCVLLRLSRTIPIFGRLRAAAILSAGLAALLLVLYVAQRAALFGVAPAHAATHQETSQLAETERPVRVAPQRERPGGVRGWFLERFERELRYVTWQPRRGLELGLATLVFNVYTPRVERYVMPPNPEGPPPSKLPAVRLDYLAFDLRAPGVIGGLAWSSAVLLAFGAWWLRRNRGAPRDPVAVFCASWLGFYFVVFNLYHVYPIDSSGRGNDVFLFAPNMLFPLLVLVALAYDRARLDALPWLRRGFLAAMTVAVLAAIANTGFHVRDLLALYVTASGQ